MDQSLAAVSWMGLLAGLMFGAGAGVVRAEIRADEVPASAELRLVVQSYEAPSSGHAVPRSAQPLASVQRAVSAEELRHGIVLDVPLVLAGASKLGLVVVAWVERGRPDLAFDGRMARPRRNSIVGYARPRGPSGASGSVVSIQLTARSDSARWTRAA